MSAEFMRDPEERGELGPPRRVPPTAIGSATPVPPEPSPLGPTGSRRVLSIVSFGALIVALGSGVVGFPLLFLPWRAAQQMGAVLVLGSFALLGLGGALAFVNVRTLRREALMPLEGPGASR